jgi:uncharacterized damage-inducible protein DinB
MAVERFRRELRYDDWANREVLRHLQRESSPPARCVAWFAHVLGAQSVWLARLEGERSALEVWPTLTLDELEPNLARLREAWSGYLARIAPADLGRSLSYVTTRGERCSSRVEDVLTHVLLHGAYHRGQIASELRQEGLTPPATDFVHATRTGHVD